MDIISSLATKFNSQMKLKITFLFPMLIAIAVSSCTQKEGTANQTAATENDIPDSVLVPVAVAKHYVTNYAQHADSVAIDTLLTGNPEIDSHRPKPKPRPDTRCIWFSKERLAAVLKELEKEKGSGVRFYLATYNDQYVINPTVKDAPKPEKKYWGYNTLIMVSTRDTTTSMGKIHQDYYSDLNPNLMKGSKRQGFIVGFTPENKGELCPPPADCFDFGASLLPKN